MKIYRGTRIDEKTVVTVDGRPLDLRLDLRNHSPTGFEWHYMGSGPAQLALAILADCLGDDAKALELHEDFKDQVVAGLPLRAWQLHEEEVLEAVGALRTLT